MLHVCSSPWRVVHGQPRSSVLAYRRFQARATGQGLCGLGNVELPGVHDLWMASAETSHLRPPSPSPCPKPPACQCHCGLRNRVGGAAWTGPYGRSRMDRAAWAEPAHWTQVVWISPS